MSCWNNDPERLLDSEGDDPNEAEELPVCMT